MSRVLPVGFQFELAYHPGNLIGFVLEKQRRRKRGLGVGTGDVSLSAEHQEFLRNYRNEYPESYDRDLFKERKKNAAKAAAVYDPEYEMAFPPSARQVQLPQKRRYSRDLGEMLDLAEVGQSFEGPTARVRNMPVRSADPGLQIKAPRYSSGLAPSTGGNSRALLNEKSSVFSVKLPTVQEQSDRAVITIPVQEEYSYPGLSSQEVVIGNEGTSVSDIQSSQEAEIAASNLMSDTPEQATDAPKTRMTIPNPDLVQPQTNIGNSIPPPPILTPEAQNFQRNAPNTQPLPYGTRVTSQWEKPQYKTQVRAQTKVLQPAPRFRPSQESKTPIRTPHRAQYFIRDVQTVSEPPFQTPPQATTTYNIAQPHQETYRFENQTQQPALIQPTVESHYIIQEPQNTYQASATPTDAIQDYPNLVIGGGQLEGESVVYGNYGNETHYEMQPMPNHGHHQPYTTPQQQHQSLVYVNPAENHMHSIDDHQQFTSAPMGGVAYHSVGKSAQIQYQQPRTTFRYTILPSSSSAQHLAPQRLSSGAEGRSHSNVEDRYAFHSNLKNPQVARNPPVLSRGNMGSGGRVIYHQRPLENRMQAGGTTIKIVPHQNSRKQNLRQYAEEPVGESSHLGFYSPPPQPQSVTISQNLQSPQKTGARKMFIVRPFPQNISSAPSSDLGTSVHPPDPDHKAPQDLLTLAPIQPPPKPPTPPPPPIPWWKREENTLWTLVFRQLSRKSILESCISVCKDWQRIVEEELEEVWSEMDLSGSQQPLTTEVLVSVARKRPQILNLSWTGISREDIETLLKGNSRLSSISMAGCHWSSVEGLKKLESDLVSLDLRWVQGCTDNNFKRLVGEVPKLKLVEELFMSQCDVGDPTVRYVANQFNRVRKLDLSYCGKITNVAIEVMGAAGSPARHSIRHFNLANCQNLHSDIFIPLSKMTALSVLDVRACPQITDARCLEFRDASKALGREVTVLY